MSKGTFPRWLFHKLFIVTPSPTAGDGADSAAGTSLTPEERKARVEAVVNDALARAHDPGLHGWRFVVRLMLIAAAGPLVGAALIGVWRWLVAW